MKTLKTFILVSILFFAFYLTASFLDAVLPKFVLPAINTGNGITKITLRHFCQRPENMFAPRYFNEFLNNITREKSGVLSYKFTYVTIIFLYLFFMIGLSFVIANGAMKDCALEQRYEKVRDFILRGVDYLKTFQRYFITRNNVFVFLARISNAFLQLVLVSLISRVLGKESFGIFSFITTVVFIALNLANIGLDTLMIRTTAGNTLNTGQKLSNTLFVKFFTSGLVTLSVVILFIAVWGIDAVITKAFLFYSAAIIFGALTHTLWHFGDCFERLEYHSFLWGASNLLKAFVGIVAVFSSKSLEILFLGLLISEIASFLVSFWVVKRAFGTFRFSVDFKAWQNMIKDSYKIGLVVLFSILYFRISIIELQLIKGASAVGTFSSAMKCIEMLTIIPGSIVIASFPAFVTDYKNSAGKFIKRITSLLTGMFALGVFLSFVFFFFGKHIIIILYGHKFIHSTDILKVITWAVPFVFVNAILTYILISKGDDKYNIFCYFVTALAGVVTNYVFIRYFDVIGAGYAFVFTEVMLSCLLFQGIIGNSNTVVKVYDAD